MASTLGVGLDATKSTCHNPFGPNLGQTEECSIGFSMKEMNEYDVETEQQS